MILTSNFILSVSQFPLFPIYNSIFLPLPNHISIPSNTHIRLQFEHFLNQSFRAASSNPFTRLLPSGPSNNPPPVLTSWKFLRQITPLTSDASDANWMNTQTIPYVSQTAQNRNINRLKLIQSKDSLISHRRMVFTEELMAIFSCLSQLTQMPPHGRFYFLLTLSLLFSPFQTPSLQTSHPTNSFNSSFPSLNRLSNHLYPDPGTHWLPWTRRGR